MLRDREVIKFPECVDCSRVMSMKWGVTGSVVRVCSAYLFPTKKWTMGEKVCPLWHIHERKVEGKKVNVRAGLYKATGRKG